jgi:hypothetical protein
MRVGVDFLREEECEEFKLILTLSKLSFLLTYSENARPAGRTFPTLRRTCLLIGPQPMPQFLRTALGTTAHRCLFTVFPLLLCDWPTVARSPSGPIIGVGTLSSAHVVL